MKNRTIYLFVILFFVPVLAAGQNSEELSLSEAINQALEENHSIIISRNLSEIEENSATPGNAGYLPNLSLNSSFSESIEDSRLDFTNQEGQDVNESRSTRYNASLDLEWVLFDGFGNRYRLQSLQRSRDLGEVQSRQEIETTLLQVIERYLEVSTQAQLLDVTEQAVEISNERYQRAKRNFEAGGGSQVDVLNAEVNLNQDSVRVVETEVNLNQAKRNLQVLLGDNPSGDVTVQQDFELREQLFLEDLMQEATSRNAQLRSAAIEFDQAKLQLQETRSGRYPQISTNASYNYSRQESDAGQFTFQETDGFSAGITFSLPIFDGFRRNISVQNDRIRVKNSEEQQRLTEKEIESELLNAYELYNSNLYLLEKQQLNVETAELNFERTELAFEQGQVSNTDFREAQLNLLEARQDLISQRVEAKLSEIELLQISGQILNRLPGQ
jgi:outer membrane protein